MNFLYSAHFVALLVGIVCQAAPENDGEARSRKCMDTSRHKASPTQERLYKTCNVYDEMSCCKNETTYRVHKGEIYDFTKLLCKNKDLSPECKKFFLKDACFYECSPDLGQWIMRDANTQVEKLKGVPLCKSDCDNWFAACANELTCSKNWRADHEKTEFTCKASEKCQTIKDKFQTADEFCKKVWDNAYDVVDGGDCIKIDITSTKEAQDNGAVLNKGKNSGSSITYNFILVSLPILASLHKLSNNSA